MLRIPYHITICLPYPLPTAELGGVGGLMCFFKAKRLKQLSIKVKRALNVCDLISSVKEIEKPTMRSVIPVFDDMFLSHSVLLFMASSQVFAANKLHGTKIVLGHPNQSDINQSCLTFLYIILSRADRCRSIWRILYQVAVSCIGLVCFDIHRIYSFKCPKWNKRPQGRKS